jgi:AcrR family transcriptional regulator
MPRVTEAHLDARRRQILSAASRCFSRSGFHSTTMQEIAEEADLSAGALYRYFDGKEALIEALASWGREEKREVLGALTPGGGPEALARLVETLLGILSLEDAGEAARLDVRLWGEALGHPRLRKVVEGELEALIIPIAVYLREEEVAGRLGADVDPDAMARAVVALLMGMEVQKAFDFPLDSRRVSAAIGSMLNGLVR